MSEQDRPNLAAISEKDLETRFVRRRSLDRRSLLAGLCVAVGINGCGLLGLWLVSRGVSIGKSLQHEVFVDVKLLKLGRKRDLSFLPHVESAPRVAEKKLHVALDPEKNRNKKDETKPDPLTKLTDLTKQLRPEQDDDRAARSSEEGAPNGVLGGQSDENVGDPYLLEIVAAVLQRWTVPTMLKPQELAKLQASACLTIAADGTLSAFRLTEPSGNALFDGSLNATLGSITHLPKPHGRFEKAALTGKLCPTFSR